MSIVDMLFSKKQLNIQEMENGCTMEQQVDHGLCLCLCLCPCLSLYLCPSEEGEEVQPAALPNEQEDADIEVVVEQGMDSHSANQYEHQGVAVVAVAGQAGRCASCRHGVESEAEQGSPESVGRVPSAVLQIGHVEACWVVMDPWNQTCLTQKERSRLK